MLGCVEEKEDVGGDACWVVVVRRVANVFFLMLLLRDVLQEGPYVLGKQTDVLAYLVKC